MSLKFVKNVVADDGGTLFGDGILELEPLSLEGDVAEPLVRFTVFVRRFRRATEPTLVDTTAMSAIGVPVAGRELDALAGMQEAARHPGGGQPQQSTAGVHLGRVAGGEGPRPCSTGRRGLPSETTIDTG